MSVRSYSEPDRPSGSEALATLEEEVQRKLDELQRDKDQLALLSAKDIEEDYLKDVRSNIKFVRDDLRGMMSHDVEDPLKFVRWYDSVSRTLNFEPDVNPLSAYEGKNWQVVEAAIRKVHRIRDRYRARGLDLDMAVRCNSGWFHSYIVPEFKTTVVVRRDMLLQDLGNIVDSPAGQEGPEIVRTWTTKLDHAFKSDENSERILNIWSFYPMHALLSAIQHYDVLVEGGEIIRQLAKYVFAADWLPKPTATPPPPPPRPSGFRESAARRFRGLLRHGGSEDSHHQTSQSLGRTFRISRRQARLYDLEEA